MSAYDLIRNLNPVHFEASYILLCIVYIKYLTLISIIKKMQYYVLSQFFVYKYLIDLLKEAFDVKEIITNNDAECASPLTQNLCV